MVGLGARKQPSLLWQTPAAEVIQQAPPPKLL